MNDTAKQDVFLCMNLGESVLQNSALVQKKCLLLDIINNLQVVNILLFTLTDLKWLSIIGCILKFSIQEMSEYCNDFTLALWVVNSFMFQAADTKKLCSCIQLHLQMQLSVERLILKLISNYYIWPLPIVLQYAIKQK